MFLKALFFELLVFNIFINDIFLILESSNVCNYADNNTLFAFGKTFDEVTRKFQNDFLTLDEWFFSNFLVLNFEKSHFMTLGTPNTLPSFKCKNITIKNSATNQKKCSLNIWRGYSVRRIVLTDIYCKLF